MPATGYSQVPQGSQQQQLLQKGNVALENAGKKFGGLWKLLFFVSACCVITAGECCCCVSAAKRMEIAYREFLI